MNTFIFFIALLFSVAVVFQTIQLIINKESSLLPTVYAFIACILWSVLYYNTTVNTTVPPRLVKDNSIHFVWNDDEESIPKDGSLITLEMTDENTVYIGPYDPKASKN